MEISHFYIGNKHTPGPNDRRAPVQISAILLRSLLSLLIGLVVQLPLCCWAQAPPGLSISRAFQRMPTGTYQKNHTYGTLFSELVVENEPLSWIAPGGEIAPKHQAPEGSQDARLTPRYVFSAELRQHFILTRIGPRLLLSVDPAFNLRMRADLDSWPVKTPSYHIGAWGSYSIRQDTTHTSVEVEYKGRDKSEKVIKEVETVRFAYGQVGFFHYSNGQDRPPLLGQGMNELGGNFSLNSLHVAGVYGVRDDSRFWSATGAFVVSPRAWGAEQALVNRYNLARGSIKITRQVFSSFRYLLNELTAAKQGSKLGQIDSLAERRTYIEQARLHKQRFQIDLTASWGLSSLALLNQNRQGLSKRLNAEATFTYTPFYLHQAGVFATVGYYGEDPYNILFLHQYPFIRFGVAVGSLYNQWNSTPK